MTQENRTYDELAVGMSAELKRLCTADDLLVFAHASGNMNPMHLPTVDEKAGKTEIVAPSMWTGSLISAVLGNILPGAGTLYKSQTLTFLGRAHAGEELMARVEVVAKEADGQVRLSTTVTRVADQKVLCEGEAVVVAPAEKKVWAQHDMPGLQVQRHVHFDRLLARCESLDPLPTVCVAPEEANSLGGALLAADHGIMTPILVGDPAKIVAAAEALGRSLSGFEIVEATNHRQAAALAVAMINEGRGTVLMKGHLHTDELLGAVVKRDGGLRTGRRLTHVFVLDVPGMPHPLLVSDAAINIAPDLETKVDITQNAIDLAISIGLQEPKVGILSAVETVNPKIPSSLDAAILSKMAERGQIKGGAVDGPLAMDNAVNLAAARTKGITSSVAGQAEVLIAPNLDAGNMLAKNLTFIAHAEAAGVVIGAKVPIILTSRADNDKARLASCAVAALHYARTSGSKKTVTKAAAE